MTFELHNLKSAGTKRRKRVGRGNGSGHGTYSTRGQKGQRARSGGRAGLQQRSFKTILSHLPKNRGFKSLRDKNQTVNLQMLNDAFNDNEQVTPRLLVKRGLVADLTPTIKILGQGDLKKKLAVKNCLVSMAAKTKIEAAGGTVNN